MHVVVAGSSGMIGAALVAAFGEAGHRVSRLVRPGGGAGPGEVGIGWNPAAGSVDADSLEGADAVINLAGHAIGARRWTKSEKALIYSSRVATTSLLAETLAGLRHPPRVLLNASAVGYYGDRGREELPECSGPGTGFLAGVCVDWEQAASAAAAAGVRVVLLRSGMVLGRGGALARLLAPLGPAWISPYRWGLGGWVSPGTQLWPWISLKDEVRAIVHLMDSEISGAVNLVAPHPVPSKAFTKAVGRVLGRPVWLRYPKWVFRVVLGSELARTTLFSGQAVSPGRLLADGFSFVHEDVESALEVAFCR